jgi:hypothetical protein
MKLTGTYRKLVRGTTINDETLLSTDYLNHYNELVMMLEMVPDMPDMLEEAVAWQPKTYQEHFRDSAFQHRDLAVWAYENAPDIYRRPLDDCIAQLDGDVAEGLPRLQALAENPDAPAEALRAETELLAVRLRGRIDTMSALINGAMDEDGYRAALAEEAADKAPHTRHDEKVMDQSDIDALFE